MKRTRLSRKRKSGAVRRLTDMEHNFFKAVHRSGHNLETYVEKKWNKLSMKQQSEVLIGAQFGAATGATIATAGMGGFPFFASIAAAGYSGAKGVNLTIDELSQKYEHWKQAHGVK